MLKKIVAIMCVLIFVSAVAFSGGDQNCNRHRGDEGQGEVEQHQHRVN